MSPDILITGSNGLIGKAVEGGRQFIGRIENIESLIAQANGMRGIVHLASKSDRRICAADPRGCITTNLIGLCNVLDVALEKKIWVIFASTFQFKDPTLYGMSKLMGEELCRLYRGRGLKIRIIRFPVVYAPGSRKSRIVAKLIDELERGIEPVIDTDKTFHFSFVDDAVSLIEREVSVMDFKPGKPIQLTELVDGIKQCLSEKAITQ